MTDIPAYLKDYAVDYAADPRAASLRWFREARYGLFMHYGLYSLLGRHEWVQFREKIPVAEYARLADGFTADGFDADTICRAALDAGMSYVNLTTRHHDSFCLFETDHTDFHSLGAPAQRDLIAELASACNRHRLGLCLYYSHARDWKHPHAPNNEDWDGNARPSYDPPEPSYAYGDRHNLDIYLDFMKSQITELLTSYGPIAAIWLDGIAIPLSGDHERFRCAELYSHIRSLQPQVLVSYKQGLLGTEDFFAPEHHVPTATDDGSRQGQVTQHRDKPVEICTTMTPGSWGYLEDAQDHKDADAVWSELATAGAAGANLLLNTGPLPDGSLDPVDMETLKRVGDRLRSEGFPTEVTP
ncbi:MAG: alpha-L-fucosidase precursor [Gemmatimonadetes bacterium]|jgi:alpha-L-fucosidase|nr:alpha-L-fucosidase precursor [Gemmatimonadota bacterium]MBT6145445.1 alpha-L-fucosidase precursor [Gemmatimonadota bacterium]MBT7858903.1 alpha-L-fucosidase precursor [Gemmatimonadota bacterium]